MPYVVHKFALSPDMRKKLRAYLLKPTKDGLTLRFKHSRLTGETEMKITQTMKKKIEKAIAEKRGLDVHFSKSVLMASSKLRGGNALSTALAILKPIQQIVGKYVSPDFQSRVDRYLAGNGVDPVSKSEQYKKGLEYALKSKEEMTGSGGWEDFWEGLKFGFSNPIEGLKVIGKSISDAINPPKKTEGKTITWINGEGAKKKK